MTRNYFIFLLVIFAGVAGCVNPELKNSDQPTAAAGQFNIYPADGEPLQVQPERKSAQPDKYQLVIRIRMAVIEIPVGVVSSSEELWSYLDEEAVRQVRTPSMGFNGIRIGRGTKRIWPDVSRVLTRMTGRRIQEVVPRVGIAPIQTIGRNCKTWTTCS